MDDVSQSDSAAFNFALRFLDRIDVLLTFSNEAQRRGDLGEWFNILWILYKELRNELYSKDKKEAALTFDKGLDEQLKQLYGMYLSYKKRVNSWNYVQQHHPTLRGVGFTPPKDFEWQLYRFECELRQIIKDKGMQMPKKSDARFAAY